MNNNNNNNTTRGLATIASPNTAKPKKKNMTYNLVHSGSCEVEPIVLYFFSSTAKSGVYLYNQKQLVVVEEEFPSPPANLYKTIIKTLQEVSSGSRVIIHTHLKTCVGRVTAGPWKLKNEYMIKLHNQFLKECERLGEVRIYEDNYYKFPETRKLMEACDA